MPAPIVLSTLTPETKRVPNPPSGQPVIATKAEFRDGSRPGSGSGDPDPAPVPAGIDPIDGYPNSWDVEPDWSALLTQVGEGAPDSSFDPDLDIDYLGSFRINWNGLQSAENSESRDAKVFTYRPPSGTNGPNGSVFIGRFRFVGEIVVPSLSSSADADSLPVGSVKQSWVNPFTRAPSGNNNGNDQIGWMRQIDGRLFISSFNGYDLSGNSQNLLVCNDPDDLSGSSYQGFLSAWTNEHGVRYILDIPQDKQSMFGGNYFVGVCSEINIIGRGSFGHSLIALDTQSLGPSDTSVASVVWTHYPPENRINHSSIGNAAMTSHYGGLLNSPGQWEMTQYGYGADRWESGSLQEYLAVPLWHENGRTRTTFDGLPLPDQSLREHTVTYATGCGCAFIPPGSNSVIFIGSNNGARYGGTYKGHTIERGPRPDLGGVDGGFGPNSDEDQTSWYWAMNLDDVAGRINHHDPDYYKAKPWADPSPFAPRINVSGSFDSTTSKLYLMKPAGSGNYIVDVYTVGGGN